MESFRKLCRRQIMKNKNVHRVMVELAIPLLVLVMHGVIKKEWNI